MGPEKDHTTHHENSASNLLLSLVVPVFNEEQVLPVFHQRACDVLKSLPMCVEILYVNDGSTDNSLNIIQDLREKDPTIAILDLSRNFGKEIALSAGLDYAKGDAVIIIDADLQDPPELIPVLLEQWRKGYDVVYAERIAREGETRLKKASAHLFYRVLNRIGKVKVPRDTGDFRLLSRRAVDSLKELREQHRFMKGLFSWIGYPQTAVKYQRRGRYAGRTKWNYWQLWNLALEGITAFTITPLKVASYLGLVTALSAFVYALIVIWKTLVFGEVVKGYPSIMVVILFLGGIQLMALGIIGEYIGRIFNETKHRPLYFLKGYASSHYPDNEDRAHLGQGSN